MNKQKTSETTLTKTLQAMADLHDNMVDEATDEIMKRLDPLVRFSDTLDTLSPSINAEEDTPRTDPSVAVLFAVAMALDKRYSRMEQIVMRAMLHCRVALDDTRHAAMDEYENCMRDVHALKAHSMHLPPDERRPFVNRARRKLQREEVLLRDLQVEALAVIPEKDSFDPEMHELIENVPTSAAELDGKIARVDAPYFVWTNEQGQPDNRFAKVAVYQHTKSPSNAAKNGHQTRAKPPKPPAEISNAT